MDKVTDMTNEDRLFLSIGQLKFKHNEMFYTSIFIISLAFFLNVKVVFDTCSCAVLSQSLDIEQPQSDMRASICSYPLHDLWDNHTISNFRPCTY